MTFKSVKVIKNWICFICYTNMDKGSCCYVDRTVIDYNSSIDNHKSKLYICNDCAKKLHDFEFQEEK